MEPLALWILRPCLLLSSALRRRIVFEEKNIRELACQPFPGGADLAFEFASEGELEEVYTLIEEALQQGKKVELVFCSPSVEHKVQALAQRYPEKIRYLRLPLLAWKKKERLASWVQAPIFFMCRYDFFPQVLEVATRKKTALISFHHRSWRRSLFLKPFLKEFFMITTPLSEGREALGEILKNTSLKVCNPRLERIFARQKAFSPSQASSSCQQLFTIMESLGAAQKIILGNYWPSERKIFHCPSFQKAILAQEVLVCLAPHELNPSVCEQIKRGLEVLNFKVCTLGKDDYCPGDILFLETRGVLCEIYSFFDTAFVGGGHGAGVHSLFEPFAGGAKILCGPKVEKSFEYLRLKELSPLSVKLLPELENFFTVSQECSLQAPERPGEQVNSLTQILKKEGIL